MARTLEWRQSGSTEFKLLGEIEKKDKSVMVMVNVCLGGGLCERKIGDLHFCARTTARIRQHADKQHKEQDPKIRRQTNLYRYMYVLMKRSACICG